MQSSQIPVKFPIPFASSAGGSFIRAIPQTPTGVPGQASLQAGFPPENFNPVAAGGVPPFGQDFNGLLFQLSGWAQWLAAGGGTWFFDPTFSTAIGGYPKGAFLQQASNAGNFWISLVENNTVNPDSGPSANWLAFPQRTIIKVATQNYYVNPVTGSDTLYDGSSPTISGGHGPWATLNHAWTFLQTNVDANGNNIVINCAFPNTPTSYAAFTANGGITGVFTPGQVTILGDNTNFNCSIATTAAQTPAVFAQNLALFTITGFTLSASGSLSGCIGVTSGAQVDITNLHFGTAGSYCMQAFGAGAQILVNPAGVCTFSGNFISAYRASQSGVVTINNSTQNFNGVANSGGTVSAIDLGTIAANAVTFGGAGVTGSRFQLQMNSIMDTSGAQATANTAYIPGNSAGTTATGGQFQ